MPLFIFLPIVFFFFQEMDTTDFCKYEAGGSYLSTDWKEGAVVSFGLSKGNKAYQHL